MPIYSSNSPYYLQYVASTLTREQVMNDPLYCHMLEDPDIKDDLEIAYRYQEAKNGGYAEKKEFIQYLLCNGPEMDAQTIFYYRDIILNDNELYYIYNYEFSYDLASLQMDLRESVYNKPTSRSDEKKNCFSDPGAYLGPFNIAVGLGTNVREWQNPRNVYSKLVKEKQDERRKAEEKKKKAEEAAKKKKEDEAKKKKEEENKGKKKIKPNTTPVNERGLKNCTPEATAEAVKITTATTVAMADNIENNDDSVNEIGLNSGDGAAIDTAEEIQDGIQLSLYSTMGDMARLYNFGKNYSDFDPNKNKKTPLCSTLKYKYPFGLRKTNMAPQEPQAMSPFMGGMTLGGAQRVYFDESDKAFLCMFEPEGSCVISHPEEQGTVHYTNLAQTDTNRRNGKDYAGLDFCPADWSADSPPQTNNKFNIGIYVDIDTAAEYCLKTAYKGLAVGTSEDFKQLLRNGLVWAKVKLSIGSTSDTTGGVTHNSVTIYGPVLGATSKSSEANVIKVGIDPMFFATNENLKKVYPIGPPNGGSNLILTSTQKIKDGSSTIDNYSESLLKDVKERRNFEVITQVSNKIGRIRMYIPSNYKSKVEALFSGKVKAKVEEAKEGESVYFPKEIYDAGNKDGTFIEYTSAGNMGYETDFCTAAGAYVLPYPNNPRYTIGFDCGQTSQQRAIMVLSSKNKNMGLDRATQIIDAFIKYGEQYKVNPALAISIFSLETGWGKSAAFKNHNNPGGVMTGANSKTLRHFNSVDEGIRYMVKNLSKSYYVGKKFRELGLTYCPRCESNGKHPVANDPKDTNKGWLKNVSSFIALYQA